VAFLFPPDASCQPPAFDRYRTSGGVTVRSTIDCLIAAQALENGATLLHDNRDFDRIASVRPLKVIRA
jgi:predicted nucleic acid-binding protein